MGMHSYLGSKEESSQAHGAARQREKRGRQAASTTSELAEFVRIPLSKRTAGIQRHAPVIPVNEGVLQSL